MMAEEGSVGEAALFLLGLGSWSKQGNVRGEGEAEGGAERDKGQEAL